MIRSIDHLIEELNDTAAFIENAVPTAYEQHEKIGDGQFNEVFRTSIDDHPIPLVVRTLKPKHNTNINNLKKSVALLRAMPPHPAIATPLGYVEEGSTFSMLLKKLDGDLCGYLENRDTQNHPLKAKEIQGLFAQIVHGLDALHRQKLAHRDLKLENIGLIWQEDALPQLLLSDFDFLPNKPSSVLGTPDCFSPFLLQSHYEKINHNRTMENVQKDDIWALGLMLIELFDFSEEQLIFKKIRLLVNKTLFPKLKPKGKNFLGKHQDALDFLMMSHEDFYHERTVSPITIKPFAEELSNLIDELFSNTKRVYSEKFRAATKELMMGMLAFDENDRISTADILKTSFIQHYFDSKKKKKTSPTQDAQAFVETELDYTSEAFRPLAESIRQLINQLRFISATYSISRNESGNEISSLIQSDSNTPVESSLQNSSTISSSLSSTIDLALDEALKNQDIEISTSLQKIQIILLRLTESLHDLTPYAETIQLTYYNRIDRLLRQLQESIIFLQSLSRRLEGTIERVHCLIDYLLTNLRYNPSIKAVQAFISNQQFLSMYDAITATEENTDIVTMSAEALSPERANQRLNWRFLLSIHSAIHELKISSSPEKTQRGERAQAVFLTALQHAKANPGIITSAFYFLSERQGNAVCSIATALGKKEGVHLFSRQPKRYCHTLENARAVDKLGHFHLDEKSYDFLITQMSERDCSHANKSVRLVK